MKLLYSAILIICSCLLLQTSITSAQCLCGSEVNITTTSSAAFKLTLNPGPFTDDVARDVEPIDNPSSSDPDSDKDDGFVIVGSTDQGGSTGSDIYITCVGPTGSTLSGWPKIIDVDGDVDVAYSAEQTSDGYLLICGSAKTSTYITGVNNKTNAVLLKYTFDGNPAPGWPSPVPLIEYGSSGSDAAYDVKEDGNGDYVVVGKAQYNDHDIPSSASTQGDGDVWVFKVSPGNGSLNVSTNSKIYHGSNAGLDFALSLLIDCYTGNYIVSGPCQSYDPNNHGDEQLHLFNIPSNFSTPAEQTYGNISSSYLWDYSSSNIMQWHSTFDNCDQNDGYLSLGVQHPSVKIGTCFTNKQHDFWAVKTDPSFTSDATFAGVCVNANTGAAYGGYWQDNGQSSVQTCDGYLLAGITKSNYLDTDPADNQACTNCQVSCNHYVCSASETEDIWLAHVNTSTGSLDWNESVGSSDNDGAYSIKKVLDGSYILVGYTTNSGHKDIYVVKFELTHCSPPTNLHATAIKGCHIRFVWDGINCGATYRLRYKPSGGSWTTVYTTNTFYNTPLLSSGTTLYNWDVTTRCSPTILSSPVSGTSYTLSCKLDQSESESDNDLLFVFPNPTDGTFKLSLQLKDKNPQPFHLLILDATGQQVENLKLTHENGSLNKQIALDNLSGGIYCLKMIGQNNCFSKKIIIPKD